MKTELVIFDCDGVLIDSEIIVHRVISAEMTRIGFSLTEENAIKLFSGVANEDVATVIRKEYGKPIAKDNLEKIFKKIEKSFETDLESVSNMSQVLDYLDQKNLDKCIASNGVYEHITTSLTFTRLISYFKSHQIFNAAMVGKRKPAPDLFLHAAKKRKVHPENCVIIEDSMVGIAAAKAAKMKVIGFLGGSHAKNYWYRDRIVKMKPSLIAHDAKELLNILKNDLGIQ